LSKLHPDCRAAINGFVYSMTNGLLGYPLLVSVDYRAALIEESSSAEQACAYSAMYLNWMLTGGRSTQTMLKSGRRNTSGNTATPATK
jgi:hypothetical protein